MIHVKLEGVPSVDRGRPNYNAENEGKSPGGPAAEAAFF